MPDLASLKLVTKDGAVRVEILAKPRASKSRIVGEKGGVLEVAIAAPPVDGAANAELIATLARALDVPKSAIAIVRGEGGRAKLVAIAGATEEDVRARLAGG